MKPNDILLLGLKRKVTAVFRADGRHLWSTDLPSKGMLTGDDFITLASDDSRVFAYSRGQMHCLDLLSGTLIWSDPLPGYGYGLASICLPGQASAPDSAAIKQLFMQRQHGVTAAATAGG